MIDNIFYSKWFWYFWLIFAIIGFLSILFKIIIDSFLEEELETEIQPKETEKKDNLVSRIVPDHETPEPIQPKRIHKKPTGTTVLTKDRVAELKQLCLAKSGIREAKK